MPTVTLDGLNVNIIGDPHLGRVFRTGVPLHRIGDREALVWEDFEARLSQPSDLTIIMGDLFDKFVVPPEVVLKTYHLLKRAAAKGTDLVILRGNHDASRDAAKQSSFDLLAELLSGEGAFTIVRSVCYTRVVSRVLLLCGWEPFRSSADQIEQVGPNPWKEPVLAAFGHWDITQHGQDTHNLLPAEQLAALGITEAYTGHVHKPEEIQRHGVNIHVVGSMQPYAHGEQVEGDDLYVTLTVAQAEEALDIGEMDFSRSNVRILLQPGEDYTRDFDCLSKTFKRVVLDEQGQEAPQEVKYDTFDLQTLLGTACTEAGVSSALQARISTTLMERLRND